MTKSLSIVIPVYNESSNLALMIHSIKNAMKGLNYTYTIIFVDDGSDDDSINDIKLLASQHSEVSYISFFKKFRPSKCIEGRV
jgi:glycosyltransferase involved in cell wall biosynthesis